MHEIKSIKRKFGAVDCRECRFKVAYWISSNSSFIQYCDSNIERFSIASPLVIALNPFASIFV